MRTHNTNVRPPDDFYDGFTRIDCAGHSIEFESPAEGGEVLRLPDANRLFDEIEMLSAKRQEIVVTMPAGRDRDAHVAAIDQSIEHIFNVGVRNCVKRVRARRHERLMRNAAAAAAYLRMRNARRSSGRIAHVRLSRNVRARRVVRVAAKCASKATADPDGPSEPPGNRGAPRGGAL